MKPADLKAWVSLPLVVAVGTAVACLGGFGGTGIGGVPVLVICAILAFSLNALAFVPAYFRQSERYYDLTGSLTYLCVATTALVFGALDSRAVLLALLIAVWTVRLGTFLFARIRRVGHDGRFDEIKRSAPRFLLAWVLQGLWVLLTSACALAAMTSVAPVPLGIFALVGTTVWAAGFAIEVVSDSQKARFRGDPANRGRFIQTGLWAWSRHPNYFGEILLWTGVALIALPVLRGGELVTLISPIFVYLLLTRISGIPLLEARALERWGDDPSYVSYRGRTPVLFPWPPKTGRKA